MLSSIITFALHRMLLGHQIKEHKVSKICSTRAGDDVCITILVGKPDAKKLLGR
jgi:hypothetical protein